MYHRIVERFESENAARSHRVLAIDYGSVRMGFAVSDPLRLTAQGLPTLERTSKRADLSRIAQLAADYSVADQQRPLRAMVARSWPRPSCGRSIPPRTARPALLPSAPNAEPARTGSPAASSG